MVIVKDNIIYGGQPAAGISEKYDSFGSYLLDRIKAHGENVVLIDAVTSKEYTAAVLRERAIRLAHCFQSLNIKEGDVIGISSENCFEFCVVMIAAYCLNATVAPMNVTYSEREFDHALNLSKPKIVFTSPTPVENISKVAKKNSFIQQVYIFGSSKKSYSNVLRFAQLIDNPAIKSASEFPTKATDKNDNVALIVCSSGTTGLPKGVQLTQSNVMTSIDRQLDENAIDFREICTLSVIPWFHAFGCLTVLVSMSLGTRLVFLPKFEEHNFLGSIQKYNVMIAFMVPPLMVFLAKHPLVDEYDLSSLFLLVCGAAPLSRETEDAIKERIGVSNIRQGYGLSEGTLSLLVQDDELCKPGSVGGLKRGIYCKVIDPETGALLGANQRGELCFKGDCIMKGYIGDKKSTDSIMRDGWLHTGDIGYYDDDFEFFIVDRIKELIKYNGFQVPPAEIEAILLTHPKIKDAAVIGKPDEMAGELPMAFVVKQSKVDLTEDEVIEFVKKNASSAKRLRGGVRFVNEIPKNASGKILRRVLRDMISQKSKL